MDLGQCIMKTAYSIVLSCVIAYSVVISLVYADENKFNIVISPQQIFQGDVALIRLRSDQSIRSAYYIQNNRIVYFYYDNATYTYCAFLGIDLEEKTGQKAVPVKITFKNGFTTTKIIDFTIRAKDFPAEHITVPESQVTLNQQDNARYEREKKIINAVLQNPSDKSLRNNSFIKPLPVNIDTPFGVRRFFNNKPKNPHSGVDFKSPAGTQVVASNDGCVVLIGNYFFSGNSVFIDHGSGIITMYFHLASIAVRVGDNVTKGQVIGRVGSTGRATGPHLHWAMRINNQRVDPMSLLMYFENNSHS